MHTFIFSALFGRPNVCKAKKNKKKRLVVKKKQESGMSYSELGQWLAQQQMYQQREKKRQNPWMRGENPYENRHETRQIEPSSDSPLDERGNQDILQLLQYLTRKQAPMVGAGAGAGVGTSRPSSFPGSIAKETYKHNKAKWARDHPNRIIGYFIPTCPHCVEYHPVFERIRKWIRAQQKVGTLTPDLELVAVENYLPKGAQGYPFVEVFVQSQNQEVPPEIYRDEQRFKHYLKTMFENRHRDEYSPDISSVTNWDPRSYR
jgi:hypothetical protein